MVNDALSEYVTLLLRLHGFMKNGQANSEEADVIRDRMDSPWLRLTQAEIDLANDLSAALYLVAEFPGIRIPEQYKIAHKALTQK